MGSAPTYSPGIRLGSAPVCRTRGAIVLMLDADDVRRVLDRPSLIEALERMFREGCEAPLRHHHTIGVPAGGDATMLLMPAWIPGRYLGAKIANVFPGNGALGLAAVQAVYLLFSGGTGEPLAAIEAGELTARRTAAASALAARYLARGDATRLLIVGTGRLARHLAQSHAAVRPIGDVVIWGRNGDKAHAVARELSAEGIAARATADLAGAVNEADIVSCATLSREPLVRGEWLRSGTHLDLIGGFTPAMREVDDEAVRRASVFVDTQGACQEAGDLVVPIETGILARDAVRADLADLVRGVHPGRTSPTEITLFKSVGAASEDLAAAALAYERLEQPAER